MRARRWLKMKRNLKQDKKMIYTIAAIFIMLFAILIGYMVYFTLFKEKQIAAHPQNTRLNSVEDEVVRGDIYVTNGSALELIATTTEDGVRYYPYSNLYAHPVGYSQSGKMGVEALANAQLLYPNYSLVSLFQVAFMNQKFEGRDVVLTLDHRYQKAISEAMSGKKGAVVVLEASTGKIKAMYSNPNYDPNQIVANWSALNTDSENTPLINRATKGLYPPGSIFKVITTLAYIQSNDGKPLDFTHECTGSISGDDYTIKCFNQTAHGKVGLKEAFAKSCNTYFVALNKKLPQDALAKAAQSLGFNQEIPFEMDYSTSRFSASTKSSDFEKAATAIGQGRTLTTPLHMAMIAAAISNDGVSMKPYMIDYSMTKSGVIKLNNMPKQDEVLMDEEVAKKLQELMEGVVDHGTAVTVPEKGLVVGGKTGTAQNETDEDHSWFIGYAKDPEGDKATIAFAVLVEGGGKGAQALAVTDRLLEVYRSIDK